MVLSNVAALGVSLAVGLGFVIYKLVVNQKEEPHKQGNRQTGQNKVKRLMLSEYERCIAAHLVDPLTMETTWREIAGLDDVIAELKETVILPVMKRHLFQGSRLLQPPKGVLLYGPPGCGKTLIAKATAKEAGFCFINLQVSTLTDKQYGESQKLAAAVFSLAVKLQPTIIFIDEIESLLRSRSGSDHETTAMMKAQFMSLWDGLNTDHQCQVLIMGATNRPEDLDTAILRRMPTKIHIKLPNVRQREEILRVMLKNENVDSRINLREVAMETEGFSGSDLKEMCRVAALLRARRFMHSQNSISSGDSIYQINEDDLRKAISKIKKSKNAEIHGTLLLPSDDPVCLRNQEDHQKAISKMKESKNAEIHGTLPSDDSVCLRNQEDHQKAISKMKESKTGGSYATLLLLIIIFQIIIICLLFFVLL